MDIKKFDDFINEDVKIPVVDILIDNKGNVYNGILPQYPLRKGNISQVITKIPSNIKKPGPTFGKKTTTTKVVINSIVGSDSKPYPFGVDKNGYLDPVVYECNLNFGETYLYHDNWITN
jgi:hypothetical protein